jgi:hypothetical protein
VFKVGFRICQQSVKTKKKKHYFLKSYEFHSLQGVFNVIGNLCIVFGLLILQRFHIKQEELIG